MSQVWKLAGFMLLLTVACGPAAVGDGGVPEVTATKTPCQVLVQQLTEAATVVAARVLYRQITTEGCFVDSSQSVASTRIPAPTSTPAPTLTLRQELRVAVGLPANPTAEELRNTKLISYVKDYLTDSSSRAVECFDLGTKTVDRLRWVLSAGAWWTIRSENSKEVMETRKCPRFQLYEVYDWTGEVKRVDGN